MTSPTEIGSTLERSIRSGRTRVVFVAPFVKAAALSRLLAPLPLDVPVTLVTRWRPDEIRLGVSDLEAFDVVSARSSGEVRLCNTLHAKYFRIDESVWVGSANITDAAMGWSRHSNLELLVEVVWDERWRQFESQLISKSVQATKSLRCLVYEAAQALAFSLTPPEAVLSELPFESPMWIPASRSPEGLWVAYSEGSQSLSGAAGIAAQSDLQALDLPRGLQRDALNRCVGVALLQSEHISHIHSMLSASGRFGDMRRALGDHPAYAGLNRTPTEILQTTIRWLLYFCPAEYEVRVSNYSETLCRRARLSD